MIRKTLLILTLVLASSFLFGFKKDVSDFSDEDYQNAIKGKKDLIGARLEKANLKGIDLSGADLRGAELEEADLRGANLTNANLKNSDLEGANLKDAVITGANFHGAELEYAIWVDGRVCAEGSVGGCW